MYFKYIKNILFGLLITTIIINYLQINILNIRENSENMVKSKKTKVKSTIPKDVANNRPLYKVWLKSKVATESMTM
jgi:hypothetical protein